MLQKLVIGLLTLTVVGAAGVGLYDATRSDPVDNAPRVLAQSAADIPAQASLEQPIETQLPPVEQNGLLQIVPTATPPVSIEATAPLTAPIEQQAATDMVGDPWFAIGTITAIETNGVTLALKDGSTVFVELGPSNFWQAQSTLAVGDTISVEGFYNGEQYHAATVITSDGVRLSLRTETGLPLWSGGGADQSGGNGQGGNGQGGAMVQVAPDAWVTITGTVTAVNASALTMQTTTGEVLTLQLGEPGFIQQQGVSFAPGDDISVVGFWQGTTFRAGDITKLATGERVMLLDPNGRPLWGGPGRAGNGGAQGQGQGQGGQGQGGQGQGRGQGTTPMAQVPADQWITLQGYVTVIEPLAVTIVLADGQTVRAQLGNFDFWTAQGIQFAYGETLQISGFWLNNEFHAGTVRFPNGYELVLRDQNGQLLWADTNAASSGGGNGYRGGRGTTNTTGSTGGGNGYRGGRR